MKNKIVNSLINFLIRYTNNLFIIIKIDINNKVLMSSNIRNKGVIRSILINVKNKL
jgi:hypothetical protein